VASDEDDAPVAAAVPGAISIRERPTRHHLLDRIDAALGLLLFYGGIEEMPPLAPSDALAGSPRPAERSVRVRPDDPALVEVELVGPWDGVGPRFILTYDRDRDWLLVAMERRLNPTLEARAADRPHQILRMEVLETETIAGRAWPTRVEWTTTSYDHEDGSVMDVLHAMQTLEAIDPDPDIADTTFHLPVTELPVGTAVADHRHGISYVLGEPHLYMDGVLHDTGAPITDELDADAIGRLLADARPLIDPRLASAPGPLEPIPRRGPSLGTIAIVVVALLATATALAAFLLARRTHRARPGGP